MYSLLASAVHIVAGGSILSPNSVLDKPKAFHYSHHQEVAGLTFDIIVTACLLSWMVFVWYRSYGPGSRRAETRA